MQFRVWLEASWGEIYAAADAMRKYPNDWIHFTKLPKLGVNPQQSHRDPPGVYFYKNSWLLNDDNIRGFQYAITHEYYFIVRLKKDRNGINLTNMTLEQANEIATRNGWRHEFNKVYEDPASYLKDSPMPKKLWSKKKPGAIFYAAADLIANGTREGEFPFVRKSWLKSLAGVSHIVDNSGIIAEREPVQLVVMNIRNIDILDHGRNKVKSYDFEIAKKVMKELNGKWWFKDGRIHGSFEHQGNPVEITFDLGNYRFFLHYYTQGIRATSDEKLSRGTFVDVPMEFDVQDILWLIKKSLEKANVEKEGKASYWDWQKLRRLASEIMPGERVFHGADKGRAFVRVLGGTGMVFLTTGVSGNLNVNIQRNLYGDHDNVFTYRKVLRTPVSREKEEQVIQRLLADYREKFRVWHDKAMELRGK